MAKVPFLKMHGTGNDFVVFDARRATIPLTKDTIIKLADRRTGIGFDQLIVMSNSEAADIHMGIYNADGSEVAACGNATRCIGWLMLKELGKQQISIETKANTLTASRAGNHKVLVDMGMPKTKWQEIPLAKETDTLHVNFNIQGLESGVCVNMGNPHIVFFVQNAATVPLAELGPQIEHHALFPERVNVSIAEIKSPSRILLKVWERGAGLTHSCGTAACATLVAAYRRGLTGQAATVVLPGGELEIEWRKDTQHVYMTGDVATSFSGVIEL